MAALRSSGETWRAEVSAMTGTASAVRRPRIWLRRKAGSADAYRIHACHLFPTQTALLKQVAQGVLHFGVQGVRQLAGEKALRRAIHEGFDGGQQGAVAGKTNGLVGPQAVVVEAGDFAQGVVAAAVGVAGEVVELPELAQDGEAGRSAEGLLQFGQRGDLVTGQVLADQLGVERERPHNVIVPTGVNQRFVQVTRTRSAR